MRRLTVGLATVMVLGIAGWLHADYTFTVTDLGTLGGKNSFAQGINNSGQVVGYANTASGYNHAFLYSNGTMTDLGTFGGDWSFAQGINATGQVVGAATTAGGLTYAFLYSNGTMTDLGTLGGSASNAYGVNNSGQVVGGSQTATSGGDDHAFLYGNGTMTDLGTFPSHARGINDSGQVVGSAEVIGSTSTRAFVYQDGVMTTLRTLGGKGSAGFGINDSGQVVGWANTASGENHAFLYDDGTMTDLGTLGGIASVAYGINDSGQVVGNYYTSGYHAFLYMNGVMTDLTSLIDPNSGWTLQYANAINDSGEIVGWGRLGSDYRAYLLTPQVAAPTAIADEYSTAENRILTVLAPGVLSNDVDGDGDEIHAVLVTSTSHGDLELSSDGSFTYTPNNNFNREDTLTYVASDGYAESQPATVRITVTTAYPWHNGLNPLDVNDDGFITAIDALQIINALDRGEGGRLSTDRVRPLSKPFYDVNRDGFLAPIDALKVINYLHFRR